MTGVEEAQLHFLVREHVAGHLRTDLFPFGTSLNKMVFDDPLLERFGHDGPAVFDSEFIPDQLAMLFGSCWSDAIDHAVGENAFLIEPVSQGGIP
jgi:hypothetical protein